MLCLQYHFCQTRSLDSFKYNPLSHLLEAMNRTDAMLQVMFRREKISQKALLKLKEELESHDLREDVLGKLTAPCFRVLIRASGCQLILFELGKP